MSIEITMPALSPTMTEGKLSRWLKKEGDSIASGDILAEIETDKAVMEVEAIDEGVLGKILVQEGTDAVPVGNLIAVLLEEGETFSEDMLTTTTTTDASKTETPLKIEESSTPRATKVEVEEPEWEGPTKTISVREALREALQEELAHDSRVFLMGEEVAEYNGAYKVSQGLLDEFGPKRIIDTPITESGFTGICCGAAMAGLRPVVEFMTFNFALQAIDQIINSAAKTLYMSGGLVKNPIVFRGPNGTPGRVAAQHSHCFAAMYANIPGLKVVAPWSAADAKGLLKAAIRDPNPVVFLEHELLYAEKGEVPDTKEWFVPIGKARVVQKGTDVTLISYGHGVTQVMKTLPLLEEEGLSVEVIDLRTIRPLDVATLVESVQKTNRAVVVQEAWESVSVGSEISALLTEQAFDYLDAPVARVSFVDVPMPYAADLEEAVIPQPDRILEAVKTVCYKK